MTIHLKKTELLKTQAYINGQWIDSDKGNVFDVSNPATREVLANVASLGGTETRRAINAAHEALPGWQSKTGKERAQLLRRWFDLIQDNQEDLAVIMTMEQGKPLAESRAEITYGASYIEWFSEEAKRVYGDSLPSPSDRQLLTLKQAVGVVAAITPWNFPCAMLTRKAGPALAAGCTLIVKPAQETPLSALALVALAEQAGIPAGVINIVVGTDSRGIGQELTENPLVRKLSFTGSTPVGKQLIKQCADTVKKVSMELGGNAPVIVFEDADLDQAVAGALVSKYRNAGQTCICANRLLVQESVAEAFTEKYTQAVNQLVMGNGLDSAVTLGPLISQSALEEVDALVQDAITQGATVTTGGKKAIEQGEYFYQPTVLTHLKKTMRVAREEIFGPVAPIFTFSDEADAIVQANDTEFGLAAYCYTQNMGRSWRVARALDYGMVGINEVAITSEAIPFGGIKESGMGREGSKYGMDDYLELKYICIGGLTAT
jgi:succinate-semialdehyde dehydrogenase/glutarate-semialdehyde dehydrogenase